MNTSAPEENKPCKRSLMAHCDACMMKATDYYAVARLNRVKWWIGALPESAIPNGDYVRSFNILLERWQEQELARDPMIF
jgi:hypothetical protein